MVFVIGIIIWWCNFTIRILSHARDKQFWHMPWSFLWISAYILGWFYFLNHYFILSHLEQVLSFNTAFPVISLIWMSLIFVYLISSLWVTCTRNVKNLVFTTSLLTVIYLFVIFNHIIEQSFLYLYWWNSIIVYSILVIGSISLYSTMAKRKKVMHNNIELAHQIWYLIFGTLFGLGNLLLAINGIRGLLGYIDTPENMLQYLAYTFNLCAMLAVNIMVLPDDILYKTIYPVRLYHYYRLQKLRDYIFQNTDTSKYTYSKDDQIFADPDKSTHEILISILDYYPYLDKADYYRQALITIEQSAADSEDMVLQIVALRPTVKTNA